MTATRLFTDFEVDVSDFSPGDASYQLFGNLLSTKCETFAEHSQRFWRR
jgi:hypothetical protein